MNDLTADPCGGAYANMESVMKAFQQTLETKIEAESKEIDEDAKDLQDDADKWGKEKKKEDVWFKFDTWMADTDILLPNVEVTMRDKRISFDVPEFTKNTAIIRVKIPEITMTNKVIGKTPHTKTEWKTKRIGLGIKTKVPVTTVWWEDIVTKVPEVTMVEKEIKIELPVVTMGRKDIVLKLPDVRFSQKKIVMKLPQFRFHSMGINSSPDDEEGKALEERGKDLEARSTKAISDAMGEVVNESEQSVTQAIHEFFSCQLSEVSRVESDSMISFDALIAGFGASLQALSGQTAGGSGQEQMIQQLNASIAEVTRQKGAAAKSFQDQRGQLQQQEAAAINAFLNGLRENSGLHD